jgi:hypothetical protein
MGSCADRTWFGHGGDTESMASASADFNRELGNNSNASRAIAP